MNQLLKGQYKAARSSSVETNIDHLDDDEQQLESAKEEDKSIRETEVDNSVAERGNTVSIRLQVPSKHISTDMVSISSERLTMLEEPNQPPFQEITNSKTRNSTSNNSRETVLPTKLTDAPHHYNEHRRMHYLPNDNLPSDQHLVYLAFSFLLLLLLGLIMYNWCYRKKRRVDKSLGHLVAWLSSILPSFAFPRRFMAHKRNSRSEFDSELVDNNLGHSDNYAGEQVQLVNKDRLKEKVSKHARSHDNMIRVDSVQEISRSECNEKSNTEVIMKRKFAKHSFVISARSNRPKVRLLKAKVRKFIDDEAEDIRLKSQQTTKQVSWTLKLASMVLLAFRGSKSDQDDEINTKNETQDRLNQEAVEEIDLQIQRPSLKVEVHKRSDSSMVGPIDEMGIEVLSKDVDTSPNRHQLNHNLLSSNAPQLLENCSNKLSPSPIVNDGCSSISGCSLFSSSPIEPQISSCGCEAVDRDRPMAYEASMRSKSQGHSLSQLVTSSSNYRPCCSVSPSALNPTTDSLCCQSIQQQQQHHLMLNSRQQVCPRQALHKASMMSGANYTNSLAQPELKNQVKCSNHIKRHYENYYDEEQGEAYQHLSASIGMEFGLDFEPDTLVVDNSSLNYSNHLLRFSRPHEINENLMSNLIQPHGQLPFHMPRAPYCKCYQAIALPVSQNLNGIEKQPHADTKYQFKSGELLSSASTSLGGSDSGFVSIANKYSTSSCRSHLCLCQSQLSASMTPPVSFLSQQPNSQGPPPDERISPAAIGADKVEWSDSCKYKNAPSTEENSPVRVNHSAASFNANRRPRWRHKRRLSQRNQSDLAHLKPTCAPRRVSIAGNQVPVSNRDNSNDNQFYHRASIASEADCNQQRQLLFNRANPLTSNSDQPSEVSLFESQCCGKSNCSSSGGSSSGIGVSGSGCTTTSTSVFPNQKMTNLCQTPVDQSAFQHQFYPYTRCLPLNTTCQSRKFSLPVQLESTERLSPGSARPLFNNDTESANLSRAGLENAPAPRDKRQKGYRRPSESRRSSQTITRQSSFWLDDNNSDLSILSLSSVAQQSVEGAESALNQLALSNESATSAVPQPNAQNASVNSFIMSADSIESVRRHPLSETRSHPLATTDQGPLEQNNSSELASSTKDLDSSPKEKRVNQLRNAARNMRSKFSSSSNSTNSTSASSPSPDFSRPSERILALAPKSSSISKRRLFGRLRTRRLSRLSSNEPNFSGQRHATIHQHSAPSSTLAYCQRGSEGSTSKLPMGAPSVQPETGDNPRGEHDCGDFHASKKHPSKGISSTSLERQCRELWKLRATLYDDSCVGDNWTNYHQRLNRRYDSGYKSIENQLSSSLEGNIVIPPCNRQEVEQANPPDQKAHETNPLHRPQSGCSGSIRDGPNSNLMASRFSLNEVNFLSSLPEKADSKLNVVLTEGIAGSHQQDSVDRTLDGKFDILTPGEASVNCTSHEQTDRECNSRSSGSSLDEPVKK